MFARRKINTLERERETYRKWGEDKLSAFSIILIIARSLVSIPTGAKFPQIKWSQRGERVYQQEQCGLAKKKKKWATKIVLIVIFF